MNQVAVAFVCRNQLEGLSVLTNLLVRVREHAESKLALFDSGAIANVMSRKIVDKLHIRMMPKTRRIKFAYCAFEKYMGHLHDEVSLKFLAIGIFPYDVIIRLPTMIKLRARLDYYRIILQVHFLGDSEILNY